MPNPRIYTLTLASVYPHYITKAEKKGRTKEEVDAIIFWLTGYDAQGLANQLASNTTFEVFFNEAPDYHPNAEKITGLICGYRVEELTDPLERKIRQLDKLIDELAKGKSMEKILRA
jgi:hypothetical protein